VQIVKRDARQCGHVKKQIAPAVGSDEPKSAIGFLLDCAFGHLTLSSSSSSTLQQPPHFAVRPEHRYRTVARTADLANVTPDAPSPTQASFAAGAPIGVAPVQRRGP
jgi:hypothetical protein